MNTGARCHSANMASELWPNGRTITVNLCQVKYSVADGALHHKCSSSWIESKSVEIRKNLSKHSKAAHLHITSCHPWSHQDHKFPCTSTDSWPHTYTAHTPTLIPFFTVWFSPVSVADKGEAQQQSPRSRHPMIRETFLPGWGTSLPAVTGEEEAVLLGHSPLVELYPCWLVHAQPVLIICSCSIFILLQARSFVLWLSLITDDLAVMSFNLPRIN